MHGANNLFLYNRHTVLLLFTTFLGGWVGGWLYELKMRLTQPQLKMSELEAELCKRCPLPNMSLWPP